MYPPVFATLKAVSAVTAIFGTSPVRIYPFGEAPQGVTLPYCVWQSVGGTPENYVAGTPDIDAWFVQLDVYADTATGARDGAEAIRDALESTCHVVGWRGESRDPDTNHYRYSFDVDWWVSR